MAELDEVSSEELFNSALNDEQPEATEQVVESERKAKRATVTSKADLSPRQKRPSRNRKPRRKSSLPSRRKKRFRHGD
jgi:hypothetical protein